MFNYQNDKNYIIDPLTCIIQLECRFKDKGTSINDNRITFNAILQNQRSNGDNRDDLIYIDPIKSLMV